MNKNIEQELKYNILEQESKRYKRRIKEELEELEYLNKQLKRIADEKSILIFKGKIINWSILELLDFKNNLMKLVEDKKSINHHINNLQLKAINETINLLEEQKGGIE